MNTQTQPNSAAARHTPSDNLYDGAYTQAQFAALPFWARAHIRNEAKAKTDLLAALESAWLRNSNHERMTFEECNAARAAILRAKGQA